MNLDVRSIARHRDSEPQTFRVTHPFHPLFGRTILLVEVRRNWIETLIFYRGASQYLMSIPAALTTFCEADPFITLKEGRSAVPGIYSYALLPLNLHHLPSKLQ